LHHFSIRQLMNPISNHPSHLLAFHHSSLSDTLWQTLALSIAYIVIYWNTDLYLSSFSLRNKQNKFWDTTRR
jgi:hypothetical protein